MHYRTLGICVASPHCERACAVSGFRLDQMILHIVHNVYFVQYDTPVSKMTLCLQQQQEGVVRLQGHI